MTNEKKNAWGPPIPNENAENPYPYDGRRVEGGFVAYFDAVTMEPLCFIPDVYCAWAGQFYVAYTVNSLLEQGLRTSEVRKQTEASARLLNTMHLRDQVYIRTIKGCLKTSLSLEARQGNWWATDYVTFNVGDRIVMARFLPNPGREAGSYGR